MDGGTEKTHLLTSPATQAGGLAKRWWQEPVSSILMAISMESFGRYSILCNLVLFLDYWMRLSSEKAAMTTLAVIGTGYFLAVVAGVLADARLGRFKTYRLSLVLQLCGSLFLLASSLCAEYVSRIMDERATWIKALAFIGLALVGLGVACSYASVIPLGVDQYRLDGGGVAAAAGFFPRYYWFVNAGALLSYTFVSFLEINKGFHFGFICSCAGYCAALLCLQVGWKQLQLMPPLGSPLRTVWEVLREAFRRRRRLRSDSLEEPLTENVRISLSAGNTSSRPQSPLPAEIARSGWLERAKLSFGGNCADWKVDEVRMLGRLAAVLLTLTVYLTAYSQVLTTFIQQGERMRLPVRSVRNHLPASMLSCFDALAVLIAIPILYGVVFPFAKRAECCVLFLTLLRRIGCGIVLALLSVVAAFLVEWYRRNEPISSFHHYLTPYGMSNITASPMPIYYQIPQYALFGLSEVFTVVAALEFAYARAPNTMHGVCMGLLFAVQGLGSLVSSFLVKIVTAVHKDFYYHDAETRAGSVHYYFAILGALLFVSLILYSVVAKWFKGIARRGYFENG